MVHAAGTGLTERQAVHWRSLASALSLKKRARYWRAWTAIVVLPFVVCGIALVVLEPLTFVVALASFFHAWVIPELYAARGARVVRPSASSSPGDAEAKGLVCDLLDHPARELCLSTGLAIHNGMFGVWLVGEAGALLVEPKGRRVHCFCVRVPDPELPAADRIAHLLLALRSDETGFATVANHVFCGACWRVRRRLGRPHRHALKSARSQAKHRKKTVLGK
jgi:hypothetical protein